MTTLAESIRDRYGETGADDDTGSGSQGLVFIVSVSPSPQARAGKLPPLLTLTDYNIETMGEMDTETSGTGHIREMDLSDNLIMDWSTVNNILTTFPNLRFLNLARNLLSDPLPGNTIVTHNLSRLVLNGNRLDWMSVSRLLSACPRLEELRLSNNNLTNPDTVLAHNNVRELFLSLNPIDDFQSVVHNIINSCLNLSSLSLAECPVSRLEGAGDIRPESGLTKLNLSDTAVKEWAEVDRIRNIPGLNELRMMDCPFNREMDLIARRQHVIARLPNIKLLNGGDPVSETEREQAERAFIREFLDSPSSRPDRWTELVSVHGMLDPLVKIDLTPETVFRVGVWFRECQHIITVSVRQRVKHFKNSLSRMFPVADTCMKIWYHDQDLWQLTGPQEMKWPMKGLYTYCIRDGDYFVVESRHEEECYSSNKCRANKCSPEKKKQKMNWKKQIFLDTVF